jgi:sortase A
MSSTTPGGWDFSAAGATPVGGLGMLPTAEPPPVPQSNPTPDLTSALTSGPPPVDDGLYFGSPDGSPDDARPLRGDRVRTVIRGIGQTFITAGLVLLLFVVYEVWVSNIYAHKRQEKVHQQLVQAWKAGKDPLRGEDRLNLPSGKQVIIPAGQGFANLYIPRFGKDYAWTIVQGTNDADLERGPGHYSGTAVPGQIGNFSLAGHRVGKGEPFLNLDQLIPGDSIVVQTASNWFVYHVLGDAKAYTAAQRLTNKKQRAAAELAALSAPDKQGVIGREIVSPSSVEVIDPVPDHPGATAVRALLTLTTCHPKYSANQRLIIHAALVRSVAVKGNTLPKELAGGTI